MQQEEINQNKAKEGRLKNYWDIFKQYQQNRIFQNDEKKFDQQVGGECTKTNQQTEEENKTKQKNPTKTKKQTILE